MSAKRLHVHSLPIVGLAVAVVASVVVFAASSQSPSARAMLTTAWHPNTNNTGLDAALSGTFDNKAPAPVADNPEHIVEIVAPSDESIHDAQVGLKSADLWLSMQKP